MQVETNPPPTETRMITVQGRRLRIAIRPGAGGGTPLLLLNGLGVNLEVLQPFVDALDPALTVIRFDVPGAGGSPAPAIPYRFSVHACVAAQMLDQLGYRQVDVLGISWGGMLAQQFALQYPRRCRRLILVSTGTGALMVPGRLAALSQLATPFRYRDAAHLDQVAGDIYGGSVRTQPALARQFSQGLLSGGLQGYFYQIWGSAGWTSLPWLCLIRQPTLIMHGDDDPLVPVINARIMHRLIPQARLHIFQDGHLGLTTKAQELSPVVADFLRAPAA